MAATVTRDAGPHGAKLESVCPNCKSYAGNELARDPSQIAKSRLGIGSSLMRSAHKENLHTENAATNDNEGEEDDIHDDR